MDLNTVFHRDEVNMELLRSLSVVEFDILLKVYVNLFMMAAGTRRRFKIKYIFITQLTNIEALSKLSSNTRNTWVKSYSFLYNSL